jgi:DNA modification methylase
MPAKVPKSQTRARDETPPAHLTTIRLAVADLTADPKNMRTHGDANVRAISASLERWGQQRPILIDAAHTVRCGNGTLQAAKALGWTHIDCVVTNLTGAELKAYAIADNRTAELAGWSAEIGDYLTAIGSEIQDLPMEALAFDGLIPEPENEEPENGPGPLIDAAAELQKKWKTAVGQLWTIGQHRLLCGSCTEEATWARLMDGHKAVLCNTDPPYGVSFHGVDGYKQWEVIKGDHKREDDLLASLLVPAFRQIGLHTTADAAIYIWHAMSTRRDFQRALDLTAIEEKQYITWVKDAVVLGHADYQWQTEPAFYAQKAGQRCRWMGDRCQKTVWRIRPPAPADLATAIANGIRVSDGAGNQLYIGARPPAGRKVRLVRLAEGDTLTVAPDYTGNAWEIHRDPAKDRLHPTQKPVELFRIPIHNHTLPGEIIADPFSGAGGQFIAAQLTHRRCFGMDLDPKYVAVILERMNALGDATKPHLEAPAP